MNTREVLKILGDIVVPRHCVFCGTRCYKTEGSTCSGCLDDLPWNQPAESTTLGKLECSIALLKYEFPVDAAIKALKFKQKTFYASAFSEILCRAQSLLPSDIDAILPVPLHWFRKARRGYNQADEIAAPLAKELAVPLVRGVRRARATPFQSGLDAAARARNLRGAFVVRGKIRHEHVLLVDDVVTTGATLETLASVLRQAGTPRISSLCLAKAG